MFDYNEAFSRNVGWITATELAILRGKRVAIAGLGGVGGSHLLTQTRLGIGAFNIADYDRFEIQNFNRQAGACISNLEQPKIDVMARMALDINPELDIGKFAEGVTDDNLDQFLDGVDLYMDSLDFFVLEMRRKVFAACYARGIPAVTAAPLGMGSALLIFMPGRMSFEDYFQMEGQDRTEQALRFMMGLAPSRLQLPYLVDDSRVDFDEGKNPSTPMACEICAGFAGTHVMKILLNRGDIPAAPYGLHFDAYRNKLVKTWRPGGNRHPLQRLGLAIARKKIGAMSLSARFAPVAYERAIERILDAARWAPSGDNEQPWRFEIVGDHKLVIHASDTRDWNVYDLGGYASQLAVGGLLESIVIAAAQEGLAVDYQRRADSPDTAPVIDVSLRPDDSVKPDPRFDFLRTRVTQRKPFTRQPLNAAHKYALEAAAGEGYRVHWVEGEQRKAMAGLLFRSAHIRLTTEEAYEVHAKNIEWGARYSEDRLPELALGANWGTRKVMRLVLASWQRVKFANRFMAGTWLPRLEMDWLTGLNCAAHFAIVADKPLVSIDDYIEGGRAMQRFWLEATRQGLQFQPEMTPLIFTGYAERGIEFTKDEAALERARRLAGDLAGLLGGAEPSHRVYMGRVGFGPAPSSRSVRPPLEDLLLQPGS